MIALLALACAAGGPPPPAPPIEAPDAHGRPAAPSREVLGLRLGEADAPAITAWIAAHGLVCTVGALGDDPRHTCRDGLDPALLPDRPLAGPLAELLLIQKDGGPLSHLSTVRRYGAIDAAAADYREALAVLGAALGEPARASPPDLDAQPGQVVSVSARWTFSDLDVQVRLMRAGVALYTVTESWELTAAARKAALREAAARAPTNTDKEVTP